VSITPRAALLAAALIAVGACSSDPTTISPPNGEYVILPRSLWPGGTVRVTSGDFARYGDDATLELGGTTVPLERVDDQTLQATIPADFSGRAVPMLRFDSYSYPLDEITVAGYAGSRDLPEEGHIAWDAYVTTIGGVPHVIGGNLTGDLARVNLRTGIVSVSVDALEYNSLRGPGMTPTAGQWLLNGGNGIELWRIDGAPQKIDDSFHGTLPTGFTRQIAQLTANSYLQTTNRSWSIATRPDANSAFVETASGEGFDESEGLHLSTLADRAVARVNWARNGVPVFEMSTGTVAYVTDLHSVQGVDFSADGARIALAGGKGDGVPGTSANGLPTVELIRASDGKVLASLALPFSPFAVAFDPAGRWVVVGVSIPVGAGFRPGIMVLDPNDLSPLAQLPAPEAAPVCAASNSDCFGGVIAVDGDSVRAFNSFNGPAHSWRFGLLGN